MEAEDERNSQALAQERSKNDAKSQAEPQTTRVDLERDATVESIFWQWIVC